MAYINPRLRNPAEGAPVVAKAAPKTDWIGFVAALIAFGLAAATVAIVYLDWDLYTKFIGK